MSERDNRIHCGTFTLETHWQRHPAGYAQRMPCSAKTSTVTNWIPGKSNMLAGFAAFLLGDGRWQMGGGESHVWHSRPASCALLSMIIIQIDFNWCRRTNRPDCAVLTWGSQVSWNFFCWVVGVLATQLVIHQHFISASISYLHACS